MENKNSNKFFGLFGNDDHESDVITEDNAELCNIDVPNHELLVNRFVEEITTKQERKTRKNCSICEINVHKYVCPRCGVKTCSMKCSKKHKESTGCSAIRDQLSFWVIRFAQECQKRRIQYEKMPIAFKRARSNRSIYLYKEKTIYWDIDFVFPNCQAKIENRPNDSSDSYRLLCFKRNRISENRRLIDIVQDIIDQPSSLINDNDAMDMNQIDEFVFSPYQNQKYQIFFKHKSGRYYHPLQPEWTLRRNFEDKTIVEYPTLIIVLQEFAHNYPDDS
ncbi:box C/D snoRNA protein 1-like protein [Euroglyphus maynei]|uniref:Box C/D snoRNA protein 1-like protein n=1 Tax=Euroglyphus maynei TaxID=6958 RepID=A0A1Y3APE6_EURMA|nr:box C/D snoRNA protein 1-like protein [Euroglyphus maynei]